MRCRSLAAVNVTPPAVKLAGSPWPQPAGAGSKLKITAPRALGAAPSNRNVHSSPDHFDIEGKRRPYRTRDGRFYIRIGSEKREASREELSALLDEVRPLRRPTGHRNEPPFLRGLTFVRRSAGDLARPPESIRKASQLRDSAGLDLHLTGFPTLTLSGRARSIRAANTSTETLFDYAQW